MLAAANAMALHASASDPFVDNPDVPQLNDGEKAMGLGFIYQRETHRNLK